MQLIQMPRGFGKSTAIVRLMVADDDSVCMVVTRQMAKHMAEVLYFELAVAEDEGRISPRTVRPSVDDLRRRFVTPDMFGRTRTLRITKLYVDDLDLVLNAFIGHPVLLATYSPPQHWERPG